MFQVGDKVILNDVGFSALEDIEAVPSLAVGHVIELGWIDPDDVVVDFNGDGLGMQCDPAWLVKVEG